MANQKGGVGKTTTAINLGTALAAVGRARRWSSISTLRATPRPGLGIARADRRLSAYDVLMGQVPLAEAIVPTRIPGLFILPATVDLSGAELELYTERDRNYRLRAALEQFAETDQRISYVLIDCPPALSLLTVNAMAAAHAVVVPLQCEFFALEGLSMLLKTIERVRSGLNPTLEIQGIILTMFDKRNNLSDQVASDVRAHLGDKVYQTVIPRNVRISEAPSHGLPALVYDLRCPGSQAYIRLASELIQRERATVRGHAGGLRISTWPTTRPSRATPNPKAQGPRGLGRGLSALLGEGEPEQTRTKPMIGGPFAPAPGRVSQA